MKTSKDTKYDISEQVQKHLITAMKERLSRFIVIDYKYRRNRGSR